MIQQQIGKRIMELRKQAGIGVDELATRAQIDKRYLVAVERGKRNVSIGNIEKIAVGLQVTLKEFFDFL